MCVPRRIVVHVLRTSLLLAAPLLLPIVYQEPLRLIRTHGSLGSVELLDGGRGSARSENIQIARGSPGLDVLALGARARLVMVTCARGCIQQVGD